MYNMSQILPVEERHSAGQPPLPCISSRKPNSRERNLGGKLGHQTTELLELTEDLLTFSTLTKAKICCTISYGSVPTSVTCARLVSVHQLALSSLGLDGATAHFSQSLNRCPQNQRHRSQVAGKRPANCGRCGGGGPDPPLLRLTGSQV